MDIDIECVEINLELIEKLMYEKNLTQYLLAAEIDCNPSVLYKVLNKKQRYFSIPVLYAIAKFFGKNMDDFILITSPTFK